MPDTHEVKVADLQQDTANANRGTKRGTAMLKESMTRAGAGRSILLDREGRIIAGNKSAIAAAAAGIEDVIVVQTDGTKLVAVQRTDLDLDSDPKARELAFADNRVGEIDLEYDAAAFATVPDGTDLTWLFADGEIAKIAEEMEIESAMAQADTLAHEIRQRPAATQREQLPGDAPRPRTVQLTGPMSDGDVAKLRADWYGKGVQVREVRECPPESTSAPTATP
jgi:hypothetical protein